MISSHLNFRRDVTLEAVKLSEALERQCFLHNLLKEKILHYSEIVLMGLDSKIILMYDTIVLMY